MFLLSYDASHIYQYLLKMFVHKIDTSTETKMLIFTIDLLAHQWETL